MSWGEVKKINSDLSTPIDQLLKKLFAISASDVSTLKVTSVGDSTTFSVGGSIRISVSMTFQTTVTGTTKTINIYKNGTKVDELTFTRSSSYTGGIKQTDISVAKGDVLTFTESGSTSAIINYIHLDGVVTIGNAFWEG